VSERTVRSSVSAVANASVAADGAAEPLSSPPPPLPPLLLLLEVAGRVAAEAARMSRRYDCWT